MGCATDAFYYIDNRITVLRLILNRSHSGEQTSLLRLLSYEPLFLRKNIIFDQIEIFTDRMNCFKILASV